ncbi:tetratricopeptide repeat protein [Sphingomonas sp. XMGL2]|uniref:Tetratricopeptide repeat protein n=1 Tax=Sphingomonas quercus TaxID=2842451 RepID=A0ABS6BHU6_9SPHN|nr:tetratricopeptide repeat protein [Sphingomonas quercus]
MLRAAPEDYAARFSLGVLKAQQGHVDAAIDHLGKAVRLRPDVAAGWLNLGALLGAAGRFAEALDAYRRAAALLPDDPQAHRALAAALLDAGRVEESLAVFDRVLTLAPGDLEALKARGSLLWSLGRPEEALAALDSALERAPHDVETLNNHGNVLRDLRRPEDAIASYDRALALRPGSAEIHNNRGVALAETRDRPAALTAYDRALALDPSLADAWNNRGLALHEAGEIAPALACYGRAIARKPDFVAALNNRGKALCEDWRVAEAFASFMQSARIAFGDTLVIDGGERLAGAAIDPGNAVAAECAWLAADPHNVVIDGLLTPPALAGLQRFCWGSAIWRRAYAAGYRGAFPETGFACPLLAQVAEEMQASFPRIFAAHRLRYLWAFRYDQSGTGTHVHADDAAINVNFWITPDAANLDPDSGGLIFWDRCAPADWGFADYNDDADGAMAFLAETRANRVKTVYRENRAVIFDSGLFHATDAFRFKPGDRNRRINVTMLFGRR